MFAFQSPVLAKDGLRIEAGWRIEWNPERREITLFSPGRGQVCWSDAVDSFRIVEGFIDSPWQFQCLAELVAKTHGLDTAKIQPHWAQKDSSTNWSPSERVPLRVECWMIMFIEAEQKK